MTLRTCTKQPEVATMLANGHWPAACPPELRSHLAACRSCADLVRVTHAFHQSKAAATQEVRLPPPGVLWWRAQLRRRNAAMAKVSKPLFGAYVFALVVTVLVAVVAVAVQARQGFPWLAWLTQGWLTQQHAESLSPSALLASGGALAILIPLFAMVAVVGAVVVYFAAERH